MSTIRDVARRAGVSLGTVSNVLNNNGNVKPETVTKVLEAIEELDYIPSALAKNLKSNKSNVVGVLVEDICAFSAGAIIDSICAECSRREYAVNLADLRINNFVDHSSPLTYEALAENESFKAGVSSAVRSLLSARICALIYVGAHPRDVGSILPDLEIPVVYVYCYTKNNDYCINYDDFQGAELAMEHLLSNAHSKIALICGPSDSVPSRKRLLAYEQQLTNNGISLREEYIRKGNWGYGFAYRECCELMKLPEPPTAIFAMNDIMAYASIKALRDMGLSVPGDVSVHGFDNLESAWYMDPPLTTVALPLTQMGMYAAQTVFKLLEGEDVQRSVLVPCTHCKRQSIKAIENGRQ